MTHAEGALSKLRRLKDNKLVGESYFGKPKEKLEIMSCTKSVVNLAVGRLIDAGKIKSLDQPVHVNLLAGIVEIASGKRMDLYIADEILNPLGITDYKWGLDASGIPFAMAGLQLNAIARQASLASTPHPGTFASFHHVEELAQILFCSLRS